MSAFAKTCCIDVATPELRGPTTPTTFLSATSGVVRVGVVDGDLGAVLQAEAGGGVLPGQGRVDADGHNGVAGAAPVAPAALVVTGPAGREGQCPGGEHRGEYEQGTLSHVVESSPWRGFLP
jgi:hypothetical protein